jgi:hypothetical protein
VTQSPAALAALGAWLALAALAGLVALRAAATSGTGAVLMVPWTAAASGSPSVGRVAMPGAAIEPEKPAPPVSVSRCSSEEQPVTASVSSAAAETRLSPRFIGPTLPARSPGPRSPR